jgi:hypothetical protein
VQKQSGLSKTTRSRPTTIYFQFHKNHIFFEIFKKIKIECFALIYFFISLSHVLTLALCPCCIIYTFPKLPFPLFVFQNFVPNTRISFFLFSLSFFRFSPVFYCCNSFKSHHVNSKILLTNLSHRCNISRHKSRRQISRSFPPRSSSINILTSS